MRFRSTILHVLTFVTLVTLVGACANIGRPSGGDKDTQGPKIIGALPYPGTLHFDYREVKFYFDEFLKPGNYKEDIFISPVPEVEPEITVKNKTLTIKLLGRLRENTTYVITLGTGIADFNESNKMETSYSYAFSTGAVLDSLGFKGQIHDMWSGKGEADMKVLLFAADKVEGNNIKDIRPDYMIITDKDGEFEFNYLAPGEYKIFGLSDNNNDNKYNGPSEKIALAEDPLVVLKPEDSLPKVVTMVSFYQDSEGPKAKSAKWSNDYTFHVEFAEPIRPGYAGDSLSIALTDTNGGARTQALTWRFRDGDRRHLYVHASRARNADFDVHLTNLMDSLGHKRDTVLRLTKASSIREERGRWFDAPQNLRRGHEFALNAYINMPDRLDTAMIQLVDSSGAVQPIAWRSEGMRLLGKPPKLLDPTVEYRIRVRKSFPMPNGKALDTLLSYRIYFPNPDNYGTMSGRILPDSAHPGARLHVIFRGGSGTYALVQPKKGEGESGKGKGGGESTQPQYYEERFTAPSPFKFVYLHPGSYTVDLILDADGNSVLTPGSLDPYALPEKCYHQTIPMEAKAKWDVEDIEIYPIPGKGGGKGAKGGKGDVNAETPEETEKPAGPGKGQSPKGGLKPK